MQEEMKNETTAVPTRGRCPACGRSFIKGKSLFGYDFLAFLRGRFWCISWCKAFFNRKIRCPYCDVSLQAKGDPHLLVRVRILDTIGRFLFIFACLAYLCVFPVILFEIKWVLLRLLALLLFFVALVAMLVSYLTQSRQQFELCKPKKSEDSTSKEERGAAS